MTLLEKRYSFNKKAPLNIFENKQNFKNHQTNLKT